MFSSRTITPDTISGLTGWWDASDASTLFDDTTGGALVAANGAVARLEDKSGNARHFTQSTNGSRPTRRTAIKNSLDVLRFNGSSSAMGNSATFSDVMSTSQSTVFIVCVATAVTTNSNLTYQNAAVLAAASSWAHAFVSFRSNGTAFSFGYDSSGYRIASLSYTATNWAVFTTSHESSTLRVRRNGGSDATAVLGTRLLFSDPLTIGLSGSNRFFNGDLGELVIYNVALSDADRNAVESYLQNKWAI